MIEFELSNKTDDYIELNKLLKVLQLCESGAMANTFIAEGYVKLNGNIELRKRAKLCKGDIVEFEESSVKII